jgi:hypothetical protein
VKKFGLSVLGGLLVLAAALAVIYFSRPMRDVREFERRFALVKIGDSESKVVALLGEPDSREGRFRIGQEEGFEGAYARARASGSKRFLVWFKGVDVVFTVGLDEQGVVRAKEHGGT